MLYFFSVDDPGVVALGLCEPGVVVVVVSRDVLGGVAGDVEGDVVVGGEAAGVRSRSRRSPTRSVPVSVQPTARVATSARAESPVSAFFMDAPPVVFEPTGQELQRRCRRTAGRSAVHIS
jgi:hypothetical protein